MKAVVSWTPVVDGGLGGFSFFGLADPIGEEPGAALSLTARPHSTQNFAPAISGAPQCGQNRIADSYIRRTT
jgi:hypothetical protein